MKKRGRGRPSTRGQGVGTSQPGAESTPSSVERSTLAASKTVAHQKTSAASAVSCQLQRRSSGRINPALHETGSELSRSIAHRPAKKDGTSHESGAIDVDDQQKHCSAVQHKQLDEKLTSTESFASGLAELTSGINLQDDVLNTIKAQMRLVQAQRNQSNNASSEQRARSLLYPGSPIFRNTGLVIRSVAPKVRNNFNPYRPAQVAANVDVGAPPKVEEQDGRTLPLHAYTELQRNGQQKSIDVETWSYESPDQQQRHNQQENALRILERSFESVNINSTAKGAGQANSLSSTDRLDDLSQSETTTLPMSKVSPEHYSELNVASQERLFHKETKQSELNDVTTLMHLSSPLPQATISKEYVTSDNFKAALDSALASEYQLTSSSSCSAYRSTAKIKNDFESGESLQGSLLMDPGPENTNKYFLSSFHQTTDFVTTTKEETLRDDTKRQSPENKEDANAEYNSKVSKRFQHPRPDADIYFLLIDTHRSMFRPMNESIKASTADLQLLKPLSSVVGMSPDVVKPQSEFNVDHADYPWSNSGVKCVPLALNIKVEKPNNKTQCVNCKRVYRWPHVLTCFHSLCYMCIVAKYDSQERSLNCLICHKCTKVSDGLDGFQIDLPLCTEMVNANISPFLCTSCKQENEANHFCSTCKNFPCHVCLPLHKTHIIKPPKVTLDESGNVVPYCDEHAGMPIGMYCKTCSILVCKYCTNGKHSSHIIWTINAAADDAAKKVKQMKANIETMQTGCRKQIQNLNNVKQQMEEKDKRVRNEIHRICNSLIDTINSSEKVSRMLVNKAHDEIVEQMQHMVREVNDYKTLYEHSQELAPRYINQNNVEEFSLCLSHVIKTFDTLDKFYSTSPLAKPNFSVDIKFQPDYREFDEAIHHCFENIHFEHNIRLDSPTLLDRGLSPTYTHNNAELSENELSVIGDQEAVEDNTDINAVDMYPNFSRITTPFTRAFGKYGRGQYEFIEPCGVLYLHDGSLAVCDAKNHRITVFDQEGLFIRSIGETKPACPDASDTDVTLTRVRGKLCYPYRAAQCPRSHNIVVVERPPSLFIQIFSFEGEFIGSFGEKKLSYPRGLAVDECGFIFVVESRTMKFFIFDQNGDEIAQKFLASHLQFPNDIVARRGKIYISDNRSHCVHVFDYDLNCLGSIGNESLTYFPIGVALSYSDHVIVTDNHNTFNITVFAQTGQLVCGFKSRSKHANCYNVALHPTRHELAVTTKDCKVLIFHFQLWPEVPSLVMKGDFLVHD
ncbi:B-box type Zinc finger protein ncl-1 [Biomphalaria glabrata]|uniref:Uncharacterized protein LOC106054668 n=1 Tax=Biomphalaria glabrata TaxID=6526 RepID=A0A9U8DZ02_BIOGL|nr:uncharacterized protein LOC106054668 [Biomphalaria glabrata]KAI8756659.1 B-box type zinc finger protein ncl-1 isoform X2 [Biomphalaria glabrata]